MAGAVNLLLRRGGSSAGGASSAYAHGDSYVLSGSGFGTAATLKEFDDFNWGSDGDNVNLSPNVNWSTASNNGPAVPEIDNTRAYGQNSLSGMHNNGSSGDSATYLTLSSETSIYVSLMYYFTITGSPVTHKDVRVHDNTHATALPYTAYPGIFGQDFYSENYRFSVNADQSGDGTNGASYYVGGSVQDADTPGQWNRKEFYFKHSTPNTADGSIIVHRNLENILNRDGDVITRDTGVTAVFEAVLLPFYFGTGGAGTGWYNDVFISNSRQRVEIGNNATWANCTIREIQDWTAWATGEITFTVNKGTLSSGTNHVFTVADDGTATYQEEIELS